MKKLIGVLSLMLSASCAYGQTPVRGGELPPGFKPSPPTRATQPRHDTQSELLKLRKELAAVTRERDELKRAVENLSEALTKAQSESDDAAKWATCAINAVNEYNSGMELNGKPKPGEPGVFSMPAGAIKELKDSRERAINRCDRLFPKGAR